MKQLTLSLALIAAMTTAANAATYTVTFANTNQATQPDSVKVEVVNRQTATVKAGQVLNLTSYNFV